MLNDIFSLSIESSSPLRAKASDVDVVRSPSAHLVRNQRGLALVSAFFFVLLLTFSWFAFSYYSSYEEGMIRNQIRSDQAAYLAEAGVQQALWFLSRDWNWRNWAANHEGVVGAPGLVGTVSYYQWTGNLGETDKSYKVQIRSDGQIQSKIVSTGLPDTANSKVVEVELGSAFDFGLYSHGATTFRTRSFTVTGPGSKGYVYSKDSITQSSALLAADKAAGNFSGGPGNFHYFPKEIPLPELWVPQFSAKITGAPTATSVRYTSDMGEANLEIEALLHNKTAGNFRRIMSFDLGTNTITTWAPVSPDSWAANDEIALERIVSDDPSYEDFWSTLEGEMTDLNNLVYAPASTLEATEHEVPSFTDKRFTIPISSSTYVVQFKGATTFSGNTRIDGNVIFGRELYDSVNDSYSGQTTINGNMLINGNAYFFNKVTINGKLYVDGSLYVFDCPTYRNNELLITLPYWEDWQEYFAVDYDGNNEIDFDTNNDRKLDDTEIAAYVDIDESGSTTHGIEIDVDKTDAYTGGVFVRGTASFYNGVNTGSLKIAGYFYVNGCDSIKSYYDRGSGNLIADHYNNQVKIYYGDINGSWTGLTKIENDNTPETAFYVRNGSLEIGDVETSLYSRSLYTDLQGRGRVLVAQDIILHRDLCRPTSDNDPLFLACDGNFTLRRYVKTNWGSPFYGLIYVGEEAKFGISSTSGVTIGGGQIIVNDFKSNPLYGNSILYGDYKTQLHALGFVNPKDFARPLLWSETTP